MKDNADERDEMSLDRTNPVDEIELELRFEVGTARMAAGQLATLQPGYVFLLETPVDKPVAVSANGCPIGRGRLVQSDGRVGVQLLEMQGNEP